MRAHTPSIAGCARNSGPKPGIFWAKGEDFLVPRESGSWGVGHLPKGSERVREVAQGLKALALLALDPGPIPGTACGPLSPTSGDL